MVDGRWQIVNGHWPSAICFPPPFFSQTMAAGTVSLVKRFLFDGEKDAVRDVHPFPAPAVQRSIDFEFPVSAELDRAAFDLLSEHRWGEFGVQDHADPIWLYSKTTTLCRKPRFPNCFKSVPGKDITNCTSFIVHQ